MAGLALGMGAPMVSPAPAPATESSAQHQAAASNGADPTATAPTFAALKQVADYDKEIQALGSTEEVAKKIADGSIGQEAKLLLMQRWLVNEAKYEALPVETAAQPSPNPNPNPNPGPGPNPDPSPNPDPEPGPNPDPQPEPEPNPNPQPDPEPDPQPQPGPGQHGKPQDNGSANKLPATGDPALAATMATGIGGAIATLAGIVRNRRKREH